MANLEALHLKPLLDELVGAPASNSRDCLGMHSIRRRVTGLASGLLLNVATS